MRASRKKLDEVSLKKKHEFSLYIAVFIIFFKREKKMKPIEDGAVFDLLIWLLRKF